MTILRALKLSMITAVAISAAQNSAAQEAEAGPRLRAEIHGPSAIRFTLTGADRPTDVAAYRLTDGQGHLVRHRGRVLTVPVMVTPPMGLVVSPAV